MSNTINNGVFITQYLENLLEEVSAVTFYEELFELSYLQEKGSYNDGRYNAILTNITKKYNRVVTNDLYILDEAFNSKTDNYIIRPISYAGRRPIKENARELYALTIDLDGIIVDGKNNFPLGIDAFMNFCEQEIIPVPTFIVGSGSGVHLYYIFDKPIKIYLNTISFKELNNLRNALIRKIWDKPITRYSDEKDIQYESIWQGFRVVGSPTKYNTRARAFRLGERVSVDYLNKFVMPENRLINFTTKRKYTLSETEKKFPKWYKRVVVEGDKMKNTYVVNAKLYEYFKNKVKYEGRTGHRYNCLLCLVAYGVKCDIPYDRIENDIWELGRLLDKRTVDEKNHLTDSDIKDALMSYRDKDKLIRMTRKSIVRLSGIQMQERKRNYRKQDEHLKIARMIQEKENPDWRNKNGRPKKNIEIANWRYINPYGKKNECARELGISRTTVTKWWDKVYPMINKEIKGSGSTSIIELDAAKLVDGVEETLNNNPVKVKYIISAEERKNLRKKLMEYNKKK